MKMQRTKMQATTRHPQRTAGFTLVELLVTSVVVALILGSAALLFNSMNKLSRVQLHQANLQQSVRVAQRELSQYTQMAGRGGLSGGSLTSHAADTPALSIRTNVGGAGSPDADRNIAEGDADSPLAAAGTDILAVRGVFSSSVIQLNYVDQTRFVTDGTTSGSIEVASHTPTNIPQKLGPIVEACDDQSEEALILVNVVDESDYAVVALDCNQSNFASYDDDPSARFDVTIAFRMDTPRAAEYATLAPGGINPDLSDNFNPVFIGMLEEYRYYIREDFDDAGQPNYKLSRARMYPGTETAHLDEPANWEQDIAEHMYDLQVALGFDSSYDGASDSNGHFAADTNNLGDDDRIVDTGNQTDDWLYNSGNDWGQRGDLPWQQDPLNDPWTAAQPQPTLFYARIATVGRTADPDRGYLAPILNQIEDRTYTTTDAADLVINGDRALRHRREVLQTVIDLRNLG